MKMLFSIPRWTGARRISGSRQRAVVLPTIAMLFALLLVFCLPATAQVRFGSVVGSVSDPTGAALPGATVTLTNLATNDKRTVQSEGNGSYSFPNLAPG